MPKVWASLVYFALIAFGGLMFLGRKKENVRISFLTDTFPDFYHHVSNFYISLVILMVAGYLSFMRSKSWTSVIIIGTILILINLVYERYINLLNTKDMIDAYYGIAGCFVALIFLFFYNNWGLFLNPDYDEES